MSKFLWHTLSADHEIDGLISDVIGHTVNTGTKKRDLLMPILGGNLTGTSGSLQQVLLLLTSLFFPFTRFIHYNFTLQYQKCTLSEYRSRTLILY